MCEDINVDVNVEDDVYEDVKNIDIYIYIEMSMSKGICTKM